MRKLCIAAMAVAMFTSGCANGSRSRFPTSEGSLALDRVVLYRNGVGYFERSGELDGNVLTIKVRKDQVNDLLKSLTIVDENGQALSVSMPLDPTTWANAALASLQPGQGSLYDVLDSLRGVDVELSTTQGPMAGRIVMVERSEQEPDPSMPAAKSRNGGPSPLGSDAKVTLMREQEMRIVRLSKVKGVKLTDRDLSMQFHRRLDASAGEGMFQQVAVSIRLHGAGDHNLRVSYVVEAPMWKPTYRIVLPEDGEGGGALLQAWAVVDNKSGEDWNDVTMSLTSGAPIAFRYDLHTPRDVYREDLSHVGQAKHARARVGETTWGKDEAKGDGGEDDWEAEEREAAKPSAPASAVAPGGWAANKKRAPARGRARLRSEPTDSDNEYYDEPPAEPSPDMTRDALRRSTMAQTRSSQAAGLTIFNLERKLDVPDSSATMVALINQEVKGEQTFMFDPAGGGGSGYESNPYRVIRFLNSTDYVLEPGPISIFAGGSFVGEGLSQAVGSKTTATIPFAVEPTIMVEQKSSGIPQDVKLIKIVRGVIHVERFDRRKTVWAVQSQVKDDGFTVLIKHPKLGGAYQLKDRPTGTEDLPGAYLVPVVVPAGQKKGEVELIEQSPHRTTIGIHNSELLPTLRKVLLATDVGPDAKAKLRPIVALRDEMGKIEAEIRSLEQQKRVVNERADYARENIAALKEDKSAAATKLRRDQEARLKEFTDEGNRMAREIVKLNDTLRQEEIKLGDMLRDLTITVEK